MKDASLATTLYLDSLVYSFGAISVFCFNVARVALPETSCCRATGMSGCLFVLKSLICSSITSKSLSKRGSLMSTWLTLCACATPVHF